MLPPTSRSDPDASIRQTDVDAAGARLSAVRKNYLDDPFIHSFVPRAQFQPLRPPLINIGTYVRSAAIDALVEQWLRSSDKPCQIVSLGSGSDTRFWRIATGATQDKLARYIEVDFPEVTTKKAMTIRKNKELSSILGNPQDVMLGNGGTSLHSPRYHLVPGDLRHSPSEGLGRVLAALAPSTGTSPLLSPTLPTLLLFECVLVYMTPLASSALLKWFVEYFSQDKITSEENGGAVVGGIIYEMFGLSDSFGRVMVNNLKMRNVTLPGAEPYPTKDSLTGRFLDNGFTSARALTLYDIYRDCIHSSELERQVAGLDHFLRRCLTLPRISKLEMLDEVEELNLVLEHYAITWGLFVPALGPTGHWAQWGLSSRSEAGTVKEE